MMGWFRTRGYEMSITITDPALLAQLAQASGTTALRDPSGRVIGTFQVLPPNTLPPGFKIPFTEEQLAEFSKQRTGRPVGDVLKDLKDKYGE